MTELKPCPFCGEIPEYDPDPVSGLAIIRCPKESSCSGSGLVNAVSGGLPLSAAAKVWNTRQSPWISVDDRLPEEQGFYFSLDDCGRGNVDWFSGKDFENEYLTHWMPIPPTQGG